MESLGEVHGTSKEQKQLVSSRKWEMQNRDPAAVRRSERQKIPMNGFSGTTGEKRKTEDDVLFLAGGTAGFWLRREFLGQFSKFGYEFNKLAHNKMKILA